jgi:hypothetical protein
MMSAGIALMKKLIVKESSTLCAMGVGLCIGKLIGLTICIITST